MQFCDSIQKVRRWARRWGPKGCVCQPAYLSIGLGNWGTEDKVRGGNDIHQSHCFILQLGERERFALFQRTWLTQFHEWHKGNNTKQRLPTAPKALFKVNQWSWNWKMQLLGRQMGRDPSCFSQVKFPPRYRDLNWLWPAGKGKQVTNVLEREDIAWGHALKLNTGRFRIWRALTL